VVWRHHDELPRSGAGKNDPGISNLSPARRATETELVWLHTDTGTRTQRLQACGSRAKAICEHLADRKPLAPPALRQQHQRAFASTPGLLGAASRVGSLMGW